MPMVHLYHQSLGLPAVFLLNQGDDTQLCQTVLCMTQVTHHLQLMPVRVVVHQSDVADLQRVVDVLDILLNVVRALLQQQGCLFLVVVRLHHVRNVPTGHDDSYKVVILVADRS